jgi:hypothetical protein
MMQHQTKKSRYQQPELVAIVRNLRSSLLRVSPVKPDGLNKIWMQA